MQQYDTDKSGDIDFQEFEVLVRAPYRCVTLRAACECMSAQSCVCGIMHMVGGSL